MIFEGDAGKETLRDYLRGEDYNLKMAEGKELIKL
jgi:hypothetical protein